MKNMTLMMIGLVTLTLAFQPAARAEMDQPTKDLLIAMAPCAAGIAVSAAVSQYQMRRGGTVGLGDAIGTSAVLCVAAYPAYGIANGAYQLLKETPEEKALNEALDKSEE